MITVFMLGKALNLFATYEGHTKTSHDDFFDSVDFETAQKCFPDSDPNLILLGCYLSHATRQGHLCVTIDDTITPFPDRDTLVPSLQKAARVFTDSPFIHREGNRFYFSKFWMAEKTFEEHLKRLQKEIPSLSVNPELVTQQLETHSELLPEQARAIQLACEKSVSIISGGPGTGKTYTAGVLIQTLWNAMDDDQRKKARFVLTAPTGKAAIHLQKSFQRVCEKLPDFPPLRAQTLHSLLGIRPGIRKGRPLSADVILVDESSMIDVQMMAQLLASVKSGARLILLGDSHQLPPVEAGSLFTDMMGQLGEVGELTHCLRAELQGMRDFSEAIYNGEVDLVMTLLNRGEHGVYRLEFSSEKVSPLLQEIVSYAVKNQPKLPDFGYESIKTYLESFCLLSPLRRGLFGVDTLNQKIYEAMQGCHIHPILITRNDLRQELYNGDTGVLVNGEYALFLSSEGLKKIPVLLLPPYEYAYCLSVHKSQGSEFRRVALLMPEGSESFGAEVFYTGVTRAKQRVDIWGSDPVLRATIEKKTYRHSGLK